MSVSTEASGTIEELSLSSLLKHSATDEQGHVLGKLSDVVAALREKDYPLVCGLILALGQAAYFVPIRDVISIERHAIRLGCQNVDLKPFKRREGELLLKENVLGHRLIDVARSALVKAYDIRLASVGRGWVVKALDVHKATWFHLGSHEQHRARDWHSFLLLMGDQQTSGPPWAKSRVTKLKPAQIADIIESASSREEDILLAQVHQDPELEADVFEELEENKQTRLLNVRSDEEVADLLSRMRADDAADAVMDLAQERRRGVLNLLADVQRTKVLALLGYQEATAGGLMGPDFIALPETTKIEDALQAVRSAVTLQPEALVIIHSLNDSGTLAGTLSLVRALQSAPEALLREAADPNLIIASPNDDIITVTTRMADFNLLSLPVVDAHNKMLGVVTVDDALEAAIPRDWSRRRSR